MNQSILSTPRHKDTKGHKKGRTKRLLRVKRFRVSLPSDSCERSDTAKGTILRFPRSRYRATPDFPSGVQRDAYSVMRLALFGYYKGIPRRVNIE